MSLLTSTYKARKGSARSEKSELVTAKSVAWGRSQPKTQGETWRPFSERLFLFPQMPSIMGCIGVPSGNRLTLSDGLRLPVHPTMKGRSFLVGLVNKLKEAALQTISYAQIERILAQEATVQKLNFQHEAIAAFFLGLINCATGKERVAYVEAGLMGMVNTCGALKETIKQLEGANS